MPLIPPNVGATGRGGVSLRLWPHAQPVLLTLIDGRPLTWVLCASCCRLSVGHKRSTMGLAWGLSVLFLLHVCGSNRIPGKSV